MTTRKRVMAALAGREVNRVPLAVWMHNARDRNRSWQRTVFAATLLPKPSRTTPIHPIRPQSQA